jgi:hypothetical protein
MARPEQVSELKAWEQWYRLARHSLACRHVEAVQYANLRFVEEQNRESLRRKSAQADSSAPASGA